MNRRSRQRLAASFSVIGYSLTCVALFALALCLAAVALWGCGGYSELDMQLQRDRVEQLQHLLDACETQARTSSAAAAACRLHCERARVP